MELFNNYNSDISLPLTYNPIRPKGMDINRIYLAKGSMSFPERQQFVERICKLFPDAEIIESLDTPHNRIKFEEGNPLERHQKGKKSLVFGELKTAVRFSDEQGNACPNYWHFSPYGYCPYSCKYCYLAGTRGVWFSPTVKIYVNLPKMLKEVNLIARRIKKQTAFYLGKLQDALALDSLTAYSTVMVPFFANQKYARLTLLTKSANIERLLDLEHNSNTILSWSVNPPEIASTFEDRAPSMWQRLEAMKLAAEKGYLVRAVIMPLIPVDGWPDYYADFTRRLIGEVPLQRLTIGGICIYKNALKLMEMKIGEDNPISKNISNSNRADDGRYRYSIKLREEMYTFIIKAARDLKPDIEVALCLEEPELWKATGLKSSMGRCNCVL